MARHLRRDEEQDLIRWFLHRMTAKDRLDLLGDRPVTATVLFPLMSHDEIMRQVQRRVEEADNQIDVLPATINL